MGSPPLQNSKWIYEPKFDGFRRVLYLSRESCYIRSKRGNVLSRFAELAYHVRAELGRIEAILDGEVIALDSEGRQKFRELMAGRGNLHYAAFDLLWLEGKDRRHFPLWRRRREFERLIPATSTVLSRMFAVEGRGLDLFRDARAGVGRLSGTARSSTICRARFGLTPSSSLGLCHTGGGLGAPSGSVLTPERSLALD